MVPPVLWRAEWAESNPSALGSACPFDRRIITRAWILIDPFFLGFFGDGLSGCQNCMSEWIEYNLNSYVGGGVPRRHHDAVEPSEAEVDMAPRKRSREVIYCVHTLKI